MAQAEIDTQRVDQRQVDHFVKQGKKGDIYLKPDPSPEAVSRWTIAGVVPDPKLVIVTGTPPPTPELGATTTSLPPITLLVTGRPSTDGWLRVAGAFVLGLAVGALIFNRDGWVR